MSGAKHTALPESLASKPNIAWEHQTLEQLKAERDYWIDRVKNASGFSSAKAADDFRRGCEAWIERREAEGRPLPDREPARLVSKDEGQ